MPINHSRKPLKFSFSGMTFESDQVNDLRVRENEILQYHGHAQSLLNRHSCMSVVFANK